jgi:hypothetical protein
MFNPNEKFIIQSISRVEIADVMNDVISFEALSIPPFTMDDARLTSVRCQQVADAMAKILDDDLSEEDRNAENRDAVHAILLKHFR